MVALFTLFPGPTLFAGPTYKERSKLGTATRDSSCIIIYTYTINSSCIYLYICIYIYVYISVYICIYTYVYIYSPIGYSPSAGTGRLENLEKAPGPTYRERSNLGTATRGQQKEGHHKGPGILDKASETLYKSIEYQAKAQHIKQNLTILNKNPTY